MSDYIPLLPYKLEYLPNELLFEIFDYVQLNDLIRGFYNLNNRFNSILFSSNVHLHILYPDDLRENIINPKILLHFAKNHRYITRLRLTKDTSIPDYRFISFSLVRSLILNIPSSELIQMVSSENFPRLEYLCIGYTSKKIQAKKLHQDIFSNAFRFLKKCSLHNVNDNEQWTGSPSIRSLSTWSDDPCTIVNRVLSAANHLTSLHLFLNWPLLSSAIDNKIILQHSNLKRLKLHLSGYWTLEKLDSFLAYIPLVKTLSLYTTYFDYLMVDFQWNFEQLAYIYLCRLPNLSCFDCELIFKNRTEIDLEQIYSLHSCFNRIKYEIFSEDDLFIRVFTDK